MNKFIILVFFLISTSAGMSQNFKKMGLLFDQTTYNFGDIQMWENQPAIFTFTNKSKHPVTILPIFAENDLEVLYPDKPIYPGESVQIKAIFYTSGTGSFTKKFPLYFSTIADPIDLKITGNIKSLSPTAYIQCPMSKPMHSKAKVELVGNVMEMDTDIPISGSTITIIGLTDRSNTTLFSDRKGNFGTKIPVGNYQISVVHPNYQPHNSTIYVGNQSGNVNIRLIPIEQVPLITYNKPAPPEPIKQPEANTPETRPNIEEETISTISGSLENSTNESIALNKVPVPETEYTPILPNPEEEMSIATIEARPMENNSSNEELVLNKVPDVELPSTDYSEQIATSEEPIATKEEDEMELYNEKLPEATTAPETTPIQTNTTTVSVQLKPEPVVVKDPIYTIKVMDKQSDLPIGDVELFILDFGKRNKPVKAVTEDDGFFESPLPEDNYRIIASADGYISNELRVLYDENDQIHRIYLTPVSDLFESIYEAKKAEQSDEDVLGKLSFGTSEFSFARDDKSTPEEPNLSNVAAEPEPVSSVSSNEPAASTEVSLRKQEKLDSLQLVIASLHQSNADLKNEIGTIRQTPISEPEVIVIDNSLSEDSLIALIGELENENSKETLKLEKAQQAIFEAEMELERKQAELDAKLVALELQENAIAEKEADLAKQALENSEMGTIEASIGPDNTELLKSEYAANNILFLIDISSSMDKNGKMDLLKESIKSLTTVLRDIDRVALIAYNQRTTVVFEAVLGDDKESINYSIDTLQTSGLTYGVNGIQKAYEILEYYYIGDGNNQIILATDGLFSKVNATMTENELNKLVRKQAKENNIQLSVVGFGNDEEADKLMVKLATSGSGQFLKIKNPWDAKTVLIEEIKLNSKLN